MKLKKVLESFNKVKNKFIIASLIAPVTVMANVDTGDILGGAELKKETAENIQSWFWISPLIYFGIAMVVGGVTWYLHTKKREQGNDQQQSAVKTIMWVAVAIGASLFFEYVIMAMFGHYFLQASGADMMKKFVIDPMRALLGFSTTTG